MKKRDPVADTTVAKKKKVYARLKFPRGMREESPMLAALATNLAALQKKSGLRKPEFAQKTLGISGAAFRMLRNKSANPKIARLLEISNRLKTPLTVLCGARDVPGRIITMDQARQHMAILIRDAMNAMQEPDLDKAKRLGVSLFQLYLIRSGDAAPTLFLCDEMAARLNISVWEFLGVDADRPLRTE